MTDGEQGLHLVPQVVMSAAKALLGCEERYREGFQQQVRALREIKEQELFRSVGYQDFWEYCRDRLEIGRRRAYDLLDAADTLDALEAANPQLAAQLANVEQVRVIAGMNEHSKVKCLELAAKVAEKRGERLTGALVADVAQKNFNWQSRQQYKRKQREKKLAERTPDEIVAAQLLEFGKHACAIMDLYESASAMVQECGSSKHWLYFETLYEWMQEAREVS